MAINPRYWQAAFPLVITSLCVGPHDFFLENWMVCVGAIIPKLKVNSTRVNRVELANMHFYRKKRTELP
jgi:hypothetical protein